MEEIWKPIKNHTGYFVSSLGRIKSYKKNSIRILKPAIKSRTCKYLCITMWSDDKVKKTHMIHTIVAKEFLKHVPNGHDVTIDHINNDQTDNSVRNLQLISSRENTVKNLKFGRANARGVSWSSSMNKWVARISINNQKFIIGYYQNIQDASIAYERALNNITQGIYPNYTGKKLSK